jgi:hypothetical protein
MLEKELIYTILTKVPKVPKVEIGNWYIEKNLIAKS